MFSPASGKGIEDLGEQAAVGQPHRNRFLGVCRSCRLWLGWIAGGRDPARHHLILPGIPRSGSQLQPRRGDGAGQHLRAAAHLQARQRQSRDRADPRPGRGAAEDRPGRPPLHAAAAAGAEVLGRDAGARLRLRRRGRTADPAQLRRHLLLHEHSRGGTVRGNEAGRDLRDRGRRQERPDRDPSARTGRQLQLRARPDVRGAAAAGHPGRRPDRRPAAGDRPLRDHQGAAWSQLGIRAQPGLGVRQRRGDAAAAWWALRPDRVRSALQPDDPGRRSRAGEGRLDEEPALARHLQRNQAEVRRNAVPRGTDDQRLLLLDEHAAGAVRRPAGAAGGQLRGRPGGAGTDLRRHDRTHPAGPAARRCPATASSSSTRTTWRRRRS